jgi:hypothetical protein
MNTSYMYSTKPPKMPKRELQALISELKQIAKVARMESCDFGSIGNASIGNKNPTQFIRERTKLWRHSWIIGPLEELIDRYEKALEKEGRDK